jgi:hypothetical protein
MHLKTHHDYTMTKNHLFQIYSEMIGNVMTDARSTGKYYHCKFISSNKIGCHLIIMDE